MKLDARQVQATMKALETSEAQHEGDPSLVSIELVMCRLLGLPDELAEQVGMIALQEINRAGNELVPNYWRRGLEPTRGNELAIAFMQGMTFKTAIDELRRREVIEGV